MVLTSGGGGGAAPTGQPALKSKYLQVAVAAAIGAGGGGGGERVPCGSVNLKVTTVKKKEKEK